MPPSGWIEELVLFAHGKLCPNPNSGEASEEGPTLFDSFSVQRNSSRRVPYPAASAVERTIKKKIKAAEPFMMLHRDDA